MRKAIIRWALLPVLMLGLSVSARAADTAARAPGITVYFSNAETGSRNAAPGFINKIKAKVVYEDSEKDKTYTMVLQLKDAATGVVCAFPDGSNAIRQTFTAEDKAGVFEFEFVLNSSHYQGRTLTEVHYIEGMATAFSNVNETEAGHIYVPAIETTAVSERGEKTVYAGKNTVICDVISYTGLAPDEEYRVVTELRDSATGQRICGEDGQPVTAASRFTPVGADGKIAVKITADLRSYGDADITVSEEIYLVQSGKNYCQILSSKNGDEEERTVSVRLSEICVLDELYATPVSGVELRIVSAADDYSCETVTDENGICRFPLGSGEPGECTVTAVPDGYYPSEGTEEFTVTAAEGECALTLKLQKKNIIKLKRTDAETGQPVPGFVTEIRDAEGNGVATLIYDEEGKTYFDANAYWDEAALAAQQAGREQFDLIFTFRDISTPSAYYPRETEWTVSIDENRNITGPDELRAVLREPVRLTVVSEKGTGIAGVKLNVYDPDGTVQGQATSDHNGNIYFTPEKTGSYLFAEETVTFETASSREQGKFTVEESGEVTGSLTVTGTAVELLNGKIVTIIAVAVVLNIWIAVRLVIRSRKRRKQKSEIQRSDGE